VQRKSLEQKTKRILQRLPDLSTILRGSLLHRTIRHSRGCSKCATGGGHSVWVLAVGFPGGKILQTSLRREQVPQVRRAMANYRKLQKALGQVCELNRLQLRAEVPREPDHD
jgi:hypothetical protein